MVGWEEKLLPLPMFEQPPQPTPFQGKKKQRSPIDRVGAALSTALWEHAGDPGAPAPFSRLTDSHLGPFERTKALFAILRDAIPDSVFEKLTQGRYQYRGEVLPIDPNKYEFDSRKVGGGSECNVYRLTSLDPNQPSLVIKIDNGVHRGVDVLVERGKELRAERDEMAEWYQSVPEFIPEEFQFIAKSPVGGRNALFTIQEYAGTVDQIHDVFRGQSQAELIALLKNDPVLRRSFLDFARITLEKADRSGEVIDTIGDKNIVLIDQSDGMKTLRYLDPHGKYLLNETSDKKKKLLQADLDFLREVSAAVQE